MAADRETDIQQAVEQWLIETRRLRAPKAPGKTHEAWLAPTETVVEPPQATPPVGAPSLHPDRYFRDSTGLRHIDNPSPRGSSRVRGPRERGNRS